MMSHWFRALPRTLHQLLAPALAVLVAVVLGACGGGGYLASPLSVTDPRPLSADFMSRKAVAYSPYRDANSDADLNAEVFDDGRILQDLQLIRAADFGMIRLFSSRAFGDRVLRIIRTNAIDLKVMLGAYPNPVVDAAAEADNQAELDETIRLANLYSDIVQAVSVGNETMVYWSTHKIDPSVMGGYILKVRQAIRQPVTTDDNWAFWAAVPKAVADVVDFAAVHTYPLLDTFYDRALWDWRQKSVADADRPAAMMNAAVAEATRQFGESRAFLDRIGLRNLPMVIGETGWTATDPNGDPALPLRAGRVNQKMYFDLLQDWVAEGRAGRGPMAIFYFQAFDEKWKQGDDGWGLFTKERQARYVLHGGAATCPGGFTAGCEALPGTDNMANSWAPPVPGVEVTAATFDIFTDDVVAGLRSDAFGGNTAIAAVVPGAAPGEGTQSLRVLPVPANYGWGFVFSSPGFEFPPETPRTTTNLSQFDTGSLTFWVKSNGYPGKIRVGIGTDDNDRDGQEVYVVLENGDSYGYCNTDIWCKVTIPVQDLKAANPKVELDVVFNKFIIADKFVENGKSLNTTGLPPIFLDGIRWQK